MHEELTIRDRFAMAHDPPFEEVAGLWRTLDKKRGGAGDITDAMQEELEQCRATIKYIHADQMLKMRNGDGLNMHDFNKNRTQP